MKAVALNSVTGDVSSRMLKVRLLWARVDTIRVYAQCSGARRNIRIHCADIDSEHSNTPVLQSHANRHMVSVPSHTSRFLGIVIEDLQNNT